MGKCVTKVTKPYVIDASGSLRVCTGHKSGSKAAIHTMRELFEHDNSNAVLLIHTSNAFNSLNRAAALHNISVLCPSIATYTINTDREPTRLFIVGRQELRSFEGTMQGNPLAMSLYAISLQPLITRLQVKSAASHCWYADVHRAFRKFGGAHRNYAAELINEEEKTKCMEYFSRKGYCEACWLVKKKFGDEFRNFSAYESKALNWPPIKPEDGTALSRFSIYLASCRNAMKGSQYSSKFDQPDKIQRLLLKLPYNMRERWRWLVDDIMELQKRPVKFDDVITFVDREARIATNPVFGKISVDTKVVTDADFARAPRRPCRHLIDLALPHMLTPLSTPRQAQSQVPFPMIPLRPLLRMVSCVPSAISVTS